MQKGDRVRRRRRQKEKEETGISDRREKTDCTEDKGRQGELDTANQDQFTERQVRREEGCTKGTHNVLKKGELSNKLFNVLQVLKVSLFGKARTNHNNEVMERKGSGYSTNAQASVDTLNTVPTEATNNLKS